MLIFIYTNAISQPTKMWELDFCTDFQTDSDKKNLFSKFKNIYPLGVASTTL